MSQQEMVPEPQSDGQQSLDDNEIQYSQQPYYWSTKPGAKEGVPKDEPASSYDEPLSQGDYQRGYTADAEHTFQKSKSTNNQRQQSQRGHYSPDGDAFEFGYRPHSRGAQQSVPYGAHVQRHRRNPFAIALLLMLGLLFIKPILGFLGILLGVAAAAIGIAIFAIVFPFILVFGIIGILALMFRIASWQRGRGPQRWRYTNYWGRPGPWRW